MQGTHDRGDALAAIPELGVQDALRRVVDDDDQGEPLLRPQGEPAVAAAVQMQQLAEARARLAPAAMPTAGAAFGHEPRALQSLLDEGIAEPHLMMPSRELVKMADIEAGIVLAVEREHALQLGDGGFLR